MQLMLEGHAHRSCQLDNDAARFTTPFTDQPFPHRPRHKIEHEEPVPRPYVRKGEKKHPMIEMRAECHGAPRVSHYVAHPWAVAQLIRSNPKGFHQ